MACLRAQRNFHKEMITRELTQNELNAIAGGDGRDDARTAGRIAGHVAGALLGSPGGILGHVIGGELGGMGGEVFAEGLYNMFNPE